VTSLSIEDITPAEIRSEEPLFASASAGGGLALDSIDALEIGIVMQQEFGLKISRQNADLPKIFYSVRSLAQYIFTQTENRA